MTFTIKTPEDRKTNNDWAFKTSTEKVAEILGSKFLHPADKVEVFRKIEKWAGQKAVEQEKINDRDGVPE